MKKYDNNYDTTAERLNVFYDKYPKCAIITELLSHELTSEGKYQAVFTARIVNEEGFTIATGHALEREGMGEINSTSWLENCETSAIGRSLKTLGIGSSGNFASKEEVDKAESKKESIEKKEAVSKGKQLTIKAKKGAKSIDLSFITDKRTKTEINKIVNGLKKIGLSSSIMLPVYNRYDKDGKYEGLMDFISKCETSELKRFITEDVMKK